MVILVTLYTSFWFEYQLSAGNVLYIHNIHHGAFQQLVQCTIYADSGA